ncbi:TonB-dependent receptor [Balneola sp. MJW-20]|uniref:TonB-dependent receptor n=1 Tax=Gracilimonas aurantiaca TaxID=3234185 RepID=UPI003466AB37
MSFLFNKRSFFVAVFVLFFGLLFSQNAFSQRVTGTVYDSGSRRPLAGANVFIAGTSVGTYTNEEGRFSLVVPEGKTLITVSFVGYETREIQIKDDLIIYLIPSVSLEELIIQGVRADKNDPVAESTVQRRELKEVYNGEQPVFFLDQLTPAIFSFSESGTRLANYGSMRLRGIGQERINITLNGVPLNDMIDQGVFFSNFTDIGNSFESVQVQRGVGTSSNGLASYAGSVNFESVNLENREQGGSIELGAGSFNSYRLNTSLSSGMINNKWSFYGSYSRIMSDGYRYNTFTDAQSFFFSGGYFGEKDLVRITAFDAGSRNGLGYAAVAQSDLESDPRTNYLNENDQDDFSQRLVQLQHTHIFSESLSTTASLYYGGAGGDFFFTYSDVGGDLAQINYPLYNDHYGLMFNAFYETGDLDLSTGIHGYIFERVNEESISPGFEDPYYRETSDKNEISWFGKAEWDLQPFKLFADVQIRRAELSIQPDFDFIGIAPEEDIIRSWTFINPRIGITYALSDNASAYASAGRMGREPTRIDILGGFSLGAANYAQALQDNFDPEYVNDYEAGVKLSYQNLALNTNLFYMDFQDEIAPIGEVLAFGVQRRRNIPDSYRTGIEVEWTYLPVRKLSLQGNLTYMQSEIKSFTTGDGQTFSNKTPILSPEWIINGKATYNLTDQISIGTGIKYVGESYLELTNDPAFILPSFFVLDGVVSYQTGPVSVRLEVNNIADEIYYSSGAPVGNEPGYFVNAGRNFFVSTRLDF